MNIFVGKITRGMGLDGENTNYALDDIFVVPDFTIPHLLVSGVGSDSILMRLSLMSISHPHSTQFGVHFYSPSVVSLWLNW